MVVKRGELTAVWRGEGRDWRGVSLVCGAFFGVWWWSVGWFWGGICQAFGMDCRETRRYTPGAKAQCFFLVERAKVKASAYLEARTLTRWQQERRLVRSKNADSLMRPRQREEG